ncbi:T6SS effector amidase Tae4 family protein [Roseibium marinum]|uniref:Putative peptidoglycan binding protein n=1 Tax=Roseibium marinum TaxID=281252 RepID=A0A2S3UPG7_9HYPH|nr:T6SS effector amidase Tae4 family protein [Roseibium marinum]POF29586.1 putative peptidoglycan binding protein [Roseibium marinum]
MPLSNPQFRDNARIRNAAENAPPLRRGDPDQEAVRILQNALISVGSASMRRSIRPDGTLDGDYGGETVAAVARFQAIAGLAEEGRTGDGVAGRLTWKVLDERAPRAPVPVSITPAPSITPRAETERTLGPGAVRLPTAATLLREYQTFRDVQGMPCGQESVTNQCAVRMSVALMRADIGFHFDRSRIRHTHSATNRRCGTDVAHNASASRLIDYLRGIWTFQRFSKAGSDSMTAEQIERTLSGPPGIIYFEDCFRRSDGTSGDHIDFWDGSRVMNDRLNYNGPGEREAGEGPSSRRWFRNIRRNLWFLAIPQ